MNIALTITNHVKIVSKGGCGSVIGTWHGKDMHYTANVKGRVFEEKSFAELQSSIHKYVILDKAAD